LVASLPTISGWSRSEAKSAKEEEEEEDLDVPPPFPLLDSHQRSQAPAPSFAVAPPSPPRIAEEPPSELNIAILPDATPIGNMAPPPSTTAKPNFGLQAGGDGNNESKEVKKKSRGKVALAPGCSALDWARLTQSGKHLKGIGGMGFLRVTMAELAKVCLELSIDSA